MTKRVTVANLQADLAKATEALERTEIDLGESRGLVVELNQKITRLSKGNDELQAIAKDAEKATSLMRYQRDALIGFVEASRADRAVPHYNQGMHQMIDDAPQQRTYLDEFLDRVREEYQGNVDFHPGEWQVRR